VALTKAQQREAGGLIQRILDQIDDGQVAADGPAAVAVVRRLEGAMIALKAMDSSGLDNRTAQPPE
jgi:ribosomal protein L14E/L6E/L27E